MNKFKKNKTKIRPTTMNEGHKHTWRFGRRKSSYDNGHSHQLDIKKKLALKNGPKGHEHKLLMR